VITIKIIITKQPWTWMRIGDVELKRLLITIISQLLLPVHWHLFNRIFFYFSSNNKVLFVFLYQERKGSWPFLLHPIQTKNFWHSESKEFYIFWLSTHIKKCRCVKKWIDLKLNISSLCLWFHHKWMNT
jgi:hypothetical protein